jgi:hypothetical protein
MTAIDNTKQLGRITSAEIEIEDHGFLTFTLMFDFGGSRQGFCGIVLDDYSAADKRRIGTAAGCDAIIQLMVCFGAHRFADIKGKSAYALRASGGFNEMIIGVEMPPFDGGGRFALSDWKARWFPGAAP